MIPQLSASTSVITHALTEPEGVWVHPAFWEPPNKTLRYQHESNSLTTLSGTFVFSHELAWESPGACERTNVLIVASVRTSDKVPALWLALNIIFSQILVCAYSYEYQVINYASQQQSRTFDQGEKGMFAQNIWSVGWLCLLLPDRADFSDLKWHFPTYPAVNRDLTLSSQMYKTTILNAPH